MTLKSQTWARDFFYQVAMAAKAIRRYERQRERQREALFALGKPGQGCVHGAKADATDRIDAYLDSEQEPEWLQDARGDVDSFLALMDRLRKEYASTLFESTYAAQYHFLDGLSLKQTAQELGVSTTTVTIRISTLIDYLDYQGPSTIKIEWSKK